MNFIQLEESIKSAQAVLYPETKSRPKETFSLYQYEAAEKAVLEYYDKTCFHGLECTGCERDMAVEKIIAETYGIKDFTAFEELLLNRY
jgi:hypothetical protein